MLDEKLKYVAVIGAAGKMGSGISLLVAHEMMKSYLQEGKRDFPTLVLIDMSEAALQELPTYLHKQFLKYAAKQSEWVKSAAEKKHVVCEDFGVWYADQALKMCRFTANIDLAAPAALVFEAIIENIEIKTRLFTQLKNVCGPDTCILTNTSSIPIRALNEAAELEGRIIGFHFYNPPAVQKLVEIIAASETSPTLNDLAHELGRRMRKTLIPANDVVGFIGNGHFIRDGLFGLTLVEKLTDRWADYQAMYMVNELSHAIMLRPMGILQLIDYVGLDVFSLIMAAMNTYLEEDFSNGFLQACLAQNVKGGQYSDGSQKNGLLSYEQGKVVGVYSPADQQYHPLDLNGWVKQIKQELGTSPDPTVTWKGLVKDPAKEEKLAGYFASLFQQSSPGAKLAQDYLLQSKLIAQNLVNAGVANSIEDVGGVLMNGFYHLYPPVNNYY